MDMEITPESPIIRKIMGRCVLTPEGCWLWTGGTSKGGGKSHQKNPGYPSVWVPEIQTTLRAHRVIFQAFHGALPPGMHREHTCNHSLCLNPRDMEAVPPEENARRRAERDRARKNTIMNPKGGEPR